MGSRPNKGSRRPLPGRRCHPSPAPVRFPCRLRPEPPVLPRRFSRGSRFPPGFLRSGHSPRSWHKPSVHSVPVFCRRGIRRSRAAAFSGVRPAPRPRRLLPPAPSERLLPPPSSPVRLHRRHQGFPFPALPLRAYHPAAPSCSPAARTQAESPPAALLPGSPLQRGTPAASFPIRARAPVPVLFSVL